jgi:hypothetical protein
MAKVVTRPCHSPSRAVAPARGRAKRRQGRMWVGLLSDEMHIVRSAEAVSLVEGNTARTATVRSGRAPRRLRTHARMYDQGRDLGGLPVAMARSAVVAKVKAVAKRRMHGGEESDQGIVAMKLANKARGAVWRSRWSEGLGATGDAKERPCSEHRVGKPLVGLDAGPERSGTAVPEGCRHNRSEEPDALARTSGSGRGPSSNRRATATGTTEPGRSEDLWAQVAMTRAGSRTQRRHFRCASRGRRRAEQTRYPIRGMAGSALTSMVLRKAPYRTVGCLMLEAVPGKTRSPVFREGGWKRGLWWNCAPTCNRKGRTG